MNKGDIFLICISILAVLTAIKYRFNTDKEKKKRWADGYDWAAGQLLRGIPEIAISNQIMCDSEFDEGAMEALRDYQKLVEALADFKRLKEEF